MDQQTNTPANTPHTLTVSKDDLRGIAKSGCRKCYGRGYRNTMMDGTLIPCRCVLTHLHSIARTVKS